MASSVTSKKGPLRSGYTTGACAAAAAKGAAEMLLRQASVSQVSIELPTGEVASFQLHGQKFSVDSATCFVIKDAGDDPDVTNGAELHAEVTLTPTLSQGERELFGATPQFPRPPGEGHGVRVFVLRLRPFHVF